MAEALDWSVLPSCGAVTSFVGTVRDHADGRTDVIKVHYEAYRELVVPKLVDVAAAARRQWPDLGRLALLHRVGTLAVGEASVLVVVSAPHRAAAFDAARFCIDTIKAAVPIWKLETWDGGSDWGLGAQPVSAVDARAAVGHPDARIAGASHPGAGASAAPTATGRPADARPADAGHAP